MCIRDRSQTPLHTKSPVIHRIWPCGKVKFEPGKSLLRIGLSEVKVNFGVAVFFVPMQCNQVRQKMNQVISYEPANCTVPPAHSVAIIIPFRDNKEKARSHQLFVMLHFMIPILIRQNIKFQFFLINQELFIREHKFPNGQLLVRPGIPNNKCKTGLRLKRGYSIEQNC